MNATQAENLSILIRHMETNVREPLYMMRVTHPCGAPACAMGHALTVPELVERGILDGNLRGAAMDFFGLAVGGPGTSVPFRADWGRLFGASLRIHEPAGDGFRIIVRPTPKQWAEEARKVLAENGYSMDDTPYDFPAFMAKVLTPVEEEREAQ